jgi:hypothetical protein
MLALGWRNLNAKGLIWIDLGRLPGTAPGIEEQKEITMFPDTVAISLRPVFPPICSVCAAFSCTKIPNSQILSTIM